MMVLHNVDIKVIFKSGTWKIWGLTKEATLNNGVWHVQLEDGKQYIFAQSDVLFFRWEELSE